MRSLLAAVLLPSLAFAAPPAAKGAPAAAASSKPVIALLPAKGTTPAFAQLGLLLEARASELLESSGRYSELHLKQVLAMAEQEGLSADVMATEDGARRALGLLGANRVVTVAIEQDKGGTFLIDGRILGERTPSAFAGQLGKSWPEALVNGSNLLVSSMLSIDGVKDAPKGPAQPESKSEAALQALGECYATAIRQSLGLDAPVTLVGEEIDGAAMACTKALEADKDLRFARSTLALVEAIGGDDAAAAKALEGLSEGDGALEPYTLARYWMLTRFQSNKAGLAWLTEQSAKHPGELLLKAYLGDAWSVLGDEAKAAAAWNDYLAQAPKSSFAQGRLSRVLGRQGKAAEALDAAKKAKALAPESREARLQLASRLLDAKKVEEAITELKPLADEKGAPAELLVRVGWAYWLAGDGDAAAGCFQVAEKNATGPTAWRTRGRARYDLALIEAKQGRNDEAKKLYASALATGFKPGKVDPLLAKVAKDVEAAAKKDAAKADPKLRESSLFPAQADGTVDPAAAKPAAPAGFQKLKDE